jgi:hypothetical protein
MNAELFPFGGLHPGGGLIFQDVVFRGTGDGFINSWTYAV